jgi:Icc-related predicted phosphoesterase
MTKIVSFSDLHGQYSKKLDNWFLEHPADILLFAGDLQLNHFDDGKKFVEWIHKLPYRFKVCTFGNHDFNYDYTLGYARQYNDIYFLMNNYVIIDNIKIFGSPNSLWFGNWAFMNTEEELKEIYDKIPEDTNILMTHTPAFEILDQTVYGINAGSRSLRKRVSNLPNLKYHICAHIHESYGVQGNYIELYDKTANATDIYNIFMCYNVSILDEKYRFVNMPVIFDY